MMGSFHSLLNTSISPQQQIRTSLPLTSHTSPLQAMWTSLPSHTSPTYYTTVHINLHYTMYQLFSASHFHNFPFLSPTPVGTHIILPFVSSFCFSSQQFWSPQTKFAFFSPFLFFPSHITTILIDIVV